MRVEAKFWETAEDGSLRCRLCAHHCSIANGAFGFCGMRQNLKGILYTYAYGEVIAEHVDPIEKKPLYHFLPGEQAYSIATMGCNFRCSFCQNWSISQMSAENGNYAGGKRLSPEQVVAKAMKNDCRIISYTYTEPTIFFEYACDISQIASENGLFNTFVTNGYMSDEAIRGIAPYLDAANIDLKFFDDKVYSNICNAHLAPVLSAIKNMKKEGIWIEVTTLIVPGLNDSDEDLNGIASFLADAGKEIPWHISRFHPDYKYLDTMPTPMDTMERARDIGLSAGLKYVYPGNVSDTVPTSCPGCGAVLISRKGFSSIITAEMSNEGVCRECGTRIEGVWEKMTNRSS